MASPPTVDPEVFYSKLPAFHVEPLWRARGLMRPAPGREAVGCVWRYDEVRRLLLESGDVVTAAEADRRVLMLLNPGLDGAAAATANLYAGLQLVLPGEVAPKHRHAAAAIRFIVEGDGAYTAVDGEKSVMRPGDLVLTPNWTWHDHGNESDGPMIWLDGLDIPLVNKLDVPFFESPGEDRQLLTRPDDASARHWAQGRLRPLWEGDWQRRYSPVVNYPWTVTERVLRDAAADTDGTPHDGVVFRYTNPVDGGHVLPTLGCAVQLLKAGFRGAAHRHTSAAVYHVVRGNGATIVDGARLTWGPGDTFAVPGWAVHEHAAGDEEAILFSFTDEPVLESLDLLRTAPADRQEA
ncbi:cupin domain-containing protein [Conexibacter woesei]|uniref:Cupin 2 conserved barrel domain protein n=1 Tax=Conexibacter woesei (strain DSM 14684 / CCUG 47730 / CIP 108061 / JCM 11494 / NBRC 100937 / ID131577) TaxID=469383 RepID=D3FAR9_CONWI|nr:cupin domain-containing protein [Conexibacter woesei]ADB51232.1 Cupin 2 conserved barrel domain protein [Conexibacter woesei DSM 14684]